MDRRDDPRRVRAARAAVRGRDRGELTELEQRYATRIERILEQVQQTAEDVFGARATDVLPDTGLRAPSRFSFKLKDPEHALDMIVGFGRTITPGALGRRLVMRDAEQRLIDMSDRHAGRLRSELAGRVSDAVREYRRELTAAVDEAIEAIRAAIERASADRRRGERHARARLDQLARIERRCAQLAAELSAAEAAGDHQTGGKIDAGQGASRDPDRRPPDRRRAAATRAERALASGGA